MRIYTRAGDLAHRIHIFSDSQPHFKLESGIREFNEVTIERAIKNPTDLLLVLSAADVLRANGYSTINFDCRYLLGARMDRALDVDQPFTLAIIARLLNSAGFSRVRILDWHSDVTGRLVKNSINVLPYNALNQVISTLGTVNMVVPDKGATQRTMALCPGRWLIQCYKDRDPQTGKILGLRVGAREGIKGNNMLIVDDICDAGGTFTGLAKLLREMGAKKVFLFVTHGLFSKGVPLEGIDQIYTTDSYYEYTHYESVTTIPISMKDMRLSGG